MSIHQGLVFDSGACALDGPCGRFLPPLLVRVFHAHIRSFLRVSLEVEFATGILLMWSPNPPLHLLHPPGPPVRLQRLWPSSPSSPPGEETRSGPGAHRGGGSRAIQLGVNHGACG